MTDDERDLLDEALGRADAALQLSRALLQVLAEMNVVPPSILMDVIDAGVLAAEQSMGDPRATREHQVQLREMRATLDALGRPQPPRLPGEAGDVRG